MRQYIFNFLVIIVFASHGKYVMYFSSILLDSNRNIVMNQTENQNFDLVLYFGSFNALKSGGVFQAIKSQHPHAIVVGCSTGGQIHPTNLVDDDFTGVAIRFSATKIRLASGRIKSSAESQACGRSLAEQLQAEDLAGVLVLADGLNVNGSKLVAGFADIIGQDTPVFGGLAGDGGLFEETLVGADAAPQTRAVAAVGFYGKDIRIGHGSAGGWECFGPTRRITRSKDNVLFDLDGQDALSLYERYLADEAEELPRSGLFFPLRIYDPARPAHKIVRTILGVDREARSLTFAGDMPLGWEAQLMRSDFERLSDGAADAARQALQPFVAEDASTGIALLVSCIGRRLVLGQRSPEEVEAAAEELGDRFHRLGFYSYGEIAPHALSGICELHNQTMTIMTITETVVG